MADTRPDITLPANTQVDLYAALNAQAGFPAVTIGDQISVQNKGGAIIRLAAKAIAPVPADGFNTLTIGNEPFVNATGDLGAWAYSPVVGSVINVKVV